MQADSAAWPGQADQANEDWVGSTGTVAVALDGLSAPDDTGTGCVHGIPWFVKQLGSRLLVTADAVEDLRAALSIAIADVAALHPQCALGHPGTPSAAVGMIRHRLNVVDYLLLADIVIVLRAIDGSVQALSDSRVDEVVPMEKREALQFPIGSPEHRTAVSRLVEAQRPLRNADGGYWIAASEPTAADHAITGAFPADTLLDGALMTDGASRYTDVFQLGTWQDGLKILRESGPGDLIRRVRELEADDPQGERWPRFKTSDDAGAVYVRFD